MHHISKYSLLLSSFLFCGIGFVLFVNPIEKIATFSWLISLGFFLISVSRLSRYYRLRTQVTLSDPYLFQSAVSLVFAVYLLLYGYKTLPIVFPMTLGIWLLYKSALSLRKAHYLSKRSEELSKKFTFWGLIQLFTGLFLIVSPLSISIFLLHILGLFFFVIGVQSLRLFLKLHNEE